MIAVLHDLNLAALLAKRVIVLDCGRLAGEGPPDMIITDDMLQRTFGVAAAVHAARNNRETGLVDGIMVNFFSLHNGTATSKKRARPNLQGAVQVEQHDRP